jgi:hypothetical protein
MNARWTAQYVWTVHASKRDETGAVEAIYEDEQLARAFAVARSCDRGVLAASVTRFTLGQLGTRHPVVWYVQGCLQDPRAVRPDGRYYPSAL